VFTFTIFVFLLNSLKLAYLNSLILGQELLLIRFSIHIIIWMLVSFVVYGLNKLSKHQESKTSFVQILEGIAISLSVPIFYSVIVYLCISAVWGPKIIGLLWINPLTMIFLINFTLSFHRQ